MNLTSRIHQVYYTKHLRLIEFVSKKKCLSCSINCFVCYANLTNVLEKKIVTKTNTYTASL